MKPRYKFWYENRSEFDFNLELFLRHSELWRSHAFSSPSLSFLSVQKEMFDFIAMFIILDESKKILESSYFNRIKLGLFDFLDKNIAKGNWQRIEQRRNYFIKPVLVREQSNFEKMSETL